MQQRYYDPAIGRFLSVDPVTADSTNGNNFNRYKYASNNPYRFTDPDGRMDKESRKEMQEVRAAASSPEAKAAQTGVGLAGTATGAGEVASLREAKAWQAIGSTGSGPAAQGAREIADLHAGNAKTFGSAGAAISIGTGAVEAATANDASGVGHGLFNVVVGAASALGRVNPYVGLGVGIADSLVQFIDYTSPVTGETSSGWSAVNAAGADGITTNYERDQRNGPTVY